MTLEEIKRLAEGAPPEGEYSEAITWLAQEVLRLSGVAQSVERRPVKPVVAGSSPAPGAMSKPIAWRYKLKIGSDWKLADSEEDCNQLPSYEREPLYAAPAANRELLSNLNDAELASLLDKAENEVAKRVAAI